MAVAAGRYHCRPNHLQLSSNPLQMMKITVMGGQTMNLTTNKKTMKTLKALLHQLSCHHGLFRCLPRLRPCSPFHRCHREVLLLRSDRKPGCLLKMRCRWNSQAERTRPATNVHCRCHHFNFQLLRLPRRFPVPRCHAVDGAYHLYHLPLHPSKAKRVSMKHMSGRARKHHLHCHR
jgi:hypothetical protein